MVPPGAQRPGVHGRGEEQPHPAGRPACGARFDPGLARGPARRQRDAHGRLRQPYRPHQDEGQGQGRPDPARRCPGPQSRGRGQQRPAVRRQDTQAVLERLPVPADPRHRRGDHGPGAGDKGARRAVPRHHRRADRPAPLRRPRRGQHLAGAGLPLAGHRRGDHQGQEDRLPVPALRPGGPLRPGAHVRQGAARQGGHHALRGGQPRAGHRAGAGRQADARLERRHLDRLPRAGGGRARAEQRDDRGPQGVRQEHAQELRGRLGRRRRHGGQDGPHRRDGLQPDLRPERVGRRHLGQGLRVPHRQGLQLPAAQPRDPGPGGPGLDLQGRLLDRRGERRVPLQRAVRLPQLVLGGQPDLHQLRVAGLRRHHHRPGPRGLLRHRLLRPRGQGVEEGRRDQPQEGPGRLVPQDRP